ncbi:dynamin family protein [uncultured Tenacibaculum sp.]|uniref:dynamin family protein n=1 Tax=uncultured Tenacibaculum sp. TaxID=174713 RepID=UPI00263A29AA|nr:dynamin family protein [uncultured Tenacibaculum sp.]
MIGNNYKSQRDNTIDIANNYLAKTDENDGVDKSFLQQRVDALKNGKFLLSVAGEVKAGKSTFINALLGKEILPSDVLQATSAIVEIFKSDTSFLKVVYADDTIEELYDDLSTKDIDEAKEKLSQICRIEDKYRNIPHTLINNFIISNDKLDVTDELIENLEAVSGMNLQNEKQLIESYIAETPKSKIPVEINFGYPLNWNFEELRIVDSPGVNATGGVQDVSLKFLEKANAILFVHPIKPIESESFKNFVNKTISNKSSENLFLILTHKGLYEEDEVQRLLNEARRLYGGIIAEDRIIAVDSVLEQINNELKNQVPLKIIRENKVKKKILSSYREQAEDEERELVDVVNEAANFQQIYTTIDEYSMKAPQLQLKEILETIKAGYAEQDKLLSEKIDRLNLKKKSPQSFAREIERITEVLETFKLKIYEINLEANDVFGGNSNSEVVKNINSIVTNYLNKINAQQDDKSMKKLVIDFQNEVSSEVDKFSKNITSYFFEKLKELDISFKGTHNVTIPKIDLKAIEKFALKDSYEVEDVYESRKFDAWDWGTLGIARFFRENNVKVGTKEVFNNEKYLNNVKQQITSFLQKTKLDTITQTKNIVKDYLNNVASKVNKAINERQGELDIEKQKNLSNEKILETLDGLKKKHQTYPSIIKNIDEIIEEVTL